MAEGLSDTLYVVIVGGIVTFIGYELYQCYKEKEELTVASVTACMAGSAVKTLQDGTGDFLSGLFQSVGLGKDDSDFAGGALTHPIPETIGNIGDKLDGKPEQEVLDKRKLLTLQLRTLCTDPDDSHCKKRMGREAALLTGGSYKGDHHLKEMLQARADANTFKITHPIKYATGTY